MKNLIIFGASDCGEIAHYYFTREKLYNVVAFTVDAEYIQKDYVQNIPVVPSNEIASRFPPKDNAMFVAVSYNKMNTIRQMKYEFAKASGYEVASYISPSAIYLSQFPPGENAFIFEANVIQPFVHIGNNVTLWSGNHIGHHSTIEDNVFISSHVVVSGHCHVKKNCFIGVNASIHHQITIGESAVIGAGAIISKNVADKQVWLPPKSELYSKSSDEIRL